MAKGKAATQRVFSIIDRQPAIDAASQEGAAPLQCEGEVELRDVTFAYPQRPGACWAGAHARRKARPGMPGGCCG